MRLRLTLCSVSIAMCLSIGSGFAQDSATTFPDRNITMIVPFAAGGQVDIIARITAQAMSEEIGKTVVVENKGGAAGAIGAAYVARSAPDGYTLLAIDISFLAAPNIQAQSGYKVSDFRMVGPSTRSVLAFVVNPSNPAKDLPDFISRSLKAQEDVPFAHSGLGSTPQLAVLSFLNATKIKPLMVSYSGMAPAIADITANRIHAGFIGAAAAAGLAKDKMVKLFGVTGNRRVGSAPDTPTFNELNIKLAGFEQGTWYGVAVPAKTPDAVVAKLNAALSRALSKSTVAAQLAPLDVYPWTTGSADFEKFVEGQAEHWKQQLANVKK